MCVSVVKKDSQEFVNKPYMFFLQWHITSMCDQRCKHCYMYDSPFYEGECKNELSHENCLKIIDDFTGTAKKWGVKSCIVFGGGDPILRKDFFELLSYAREKGVDTIAVMGNSYHINSDSARRMKEYGVSLYQISLDGMRETHDFFRKPGSFDDAIRAYGVLKEAGILPSCMFTVSKINKRELIDVIRLAAELELGAFDFDRIVPMGSGKKLTEDMLEPNEYKELLLSVDKEYERLRNNGCKTVFGYKDNLWSIVKDEFPQMSAEFLPEGYELKKGCLIGVSGFAVLADGNVMACRRLPVIIGKFPEQTFEEVYFSETLESMRDFSKVNKCGSCSKSNECSGCRAVAYGFTDGDYWAEDPQCWINEEVNGSGKEDLEPEKVEKLKVG